MKLLYKLLCLSVCLHSAYLSFCQYILVPVILYICVSICMFVLLSIYSSLSLSFCLSYACIPICISAIFMCVVLSFRSIHLFVFPYVIVYTSLCLLGLLSNCPYEYLSFSPFIYLSVYLSFVCPSI